FFQAEDGIRDKLVTGVQTCALPIYRSGDRHPESVSQPRIATHMIRMPVGVEYQGRLVWQQGEGRLKIITEAAVNKDGLGPSQPCEVAAGKEPGSEVQPIGQGYDSHPCSLRSVWVNEAPRARSRRRGPLQRWR